MSDHEAITFKLTIGKKNKKRSVTVKQKNLYHNANLDEEYRVFVMSF